MPWKGAWPAAVWEGEQQPPCSGHQGAVTIHCPEHPANPGAGWVGSETSQRDSGREGLQSLPGMARVPPAALPQAVRLPRPRAPHALDARQGSDLGAEFPPPWPGRPLQGRWGFPSAPCTGPIPHSANGRHRSTAGLHTPAQPPTASILTAGALRSVPSAPCRAAEAMSPRGAAPGGSVGSCGVRRLREGRDSGVPQTLCM